MIHKGTPWRRCATTILNLTQDDLNSLNKVLRQYIETSPSVGRVPVNDGHPFYHLKRVESQNDYLHGFLDGLCLHAERVDTGNEVEFQTKGIPVHDVWKVVRAVLQTGPTCFYCKHSRDIKGHPVKIRCAHPNPDATFEEGCGFPKSFNPNRVGRCDSAEYQEDEIIRKRYYDQAPKVQTARKPRADRDAPPKKYRSYRERRKKP